MIIYGSKMYGVKNTVYSHGVCDQCGAYGKQKSYEGRKFGHIYFIPLIPLSKTVRVLKECPKCKQGMHVPVTQMVQYQAELEKLIPVAVKAAYAQQETFIDPSDNQPVNVASFLYEAAETLYLNGQRHEVMDIVETLKIGNAAYEMMVLQSRYESLSGKLDEAFASMQAAIQVRPNQLFAIMTLAELAELKGDLRTKLDCLHEASALVNHQDPRIHLMFAEVYEQTKRYPELVESLEAAFRLAPELANDKKLKKLHKKYNKKAQKVLA